MELISIVINATQEWNEWFKLHQIAHENDVVEIAHIDESFLLHLKSKFANYEAYVFINFYPFKWNK